ncbi:hypothetical protein Q8A67_020095 [Cirrhinus molitorella]|uniref:Uncharacterized protein n=1 Tax=Cirrhinus molitorella TaxID=172907 RepID=A0AA88PC27_9TELE|nr:hypothetical protein Q8A67_020095 [Cirrhinus molitorella]
MPWGSGRIDRRRSGIWSRQERSSFRRRRRRELPRDAGERRLTDCPARTHADGGATRARSCEEYPAAAAALAVPVLQYGSAGLMRSEQ